MSLRRKTAAFLAVGLFAVLVGVGSFSTDLFSGVELDSVDARFSIRGEQDPPAGLVVVEIDDDTFSDLGEQWPFPRSLHGLLIDRLSNAGAKVIAYDVQFTEETRPEEDNALIKAVDLAGNVVLATTEVNQRGEANVFGGEKVLQSVGARAGNTGVEPGRDGTVRRSHFEIDGLKSFAVVTAEVATGRPVPKSSFDEEGAWIDFAGPPDTIPTVTFSDVVRQKVDPALFKNKIVVVGASAPTLQDVHPTSAGGGLMPGPEIHANTIATVLEDLPLESAPPGFDLLLLVLLAAVGPLAGALLRPLPAFGLAVGIMVLYLVLVQAAFNSGLILPVVDPLLALTLGAIGTLGVYYLFAAFERQRVRFTFSRFVPENVVDQVLAGGEEELQLGGAKRECTLMFTDVRGFTTYSESREPTEVVEVLNRYLGEMTDAIMDHGGTLVTYMGDGIMAVFGAPLDQEDHADRAIAASREILDERLPAFCDWMRETGRGEGFKMGIGLNTGVVMSGQVGSKRRMEYTKIGDTTNTAARLEGMTKGSGHYLFLSESTREACVNPIDDLVLVGDLEVRGRDHTIRVWSIASEDEG